MNYDKIVVQAAEAEKLAQQLKKIAAKMAAIDVKYNQGDDLTPAECELANFTGDQQIRILCDQLRSQVPNLF
jgi:hypothetical protein